MFFTPTAYYSSLTVDYTSNLVAWYNFNGNANDSINGYNGVNSGLSFTDLGITGVAPDYSATFNGSTSYITIAHADDFSFGTGAFSINIWVYPVGNSAYLISKRDASFIEYQSSYNITSSTIVFNMYSGGTTTAYIGRTFTGALTANAWNMITFTFPGGTVVGDLNAYLNGTLLSGTNQTLQTYTGMDNTTAGVVLGRQGNMAVGSLNGRLDQTRIWKGKALNAAEVSKIYTDKF